MANWIPIKWRVVKILMKSLRISLFAIYSIIIWKRKKNERDVSYSSFCVKIKRLLLKIEKVSCLVSLRMYVKITSIQSSGTI
jgi:hypothetical protein